MVNRKRSWTLPRHLVTVLAVAAVWGHGTRAVEAQTELTSEQIDLRDAIEERYDVALLTEGLGLARAEGDGIRMVELRAGTIAIDGVPVTGQELRERLGDDADLILRLSYVDAAARLAMFGARSPEIGIEAPPPIAPVAPPEPASPPETVPEVARPEQPTNADRERQTTLSEIVRFGGSVRVAVDERVNGDVVVIGGSAVVDGAVTGDVVVVGGSARFGPEAYVRGEVVVVGGSVEQAPTAEVRRGITNVGFGMPFGGRRGLSGPGGWFGPRSFQVWDLAGTLVRLVFLALIGCVVVFAARGTVERVAARSAAEPVKAGLVGFLAQVLFVPVLVVASVLLAISIIGIPLLVLIPFVLIAVLIAMVVGFTGIVKGLGRWLGARMGREAPPIYLSVWIGIALLLIPTLAGEALNLAGGSLGVFALALSLTGLFVEYAAWTTGIGAIILNQFGSPLPSTAGGPPVPDVTPSASGAEPPVASGAAEVPEAPEARPYDPE
ncbi:MAG: hypothetical protein V3T48_01335 [Vicinamibacterales bacterium]